MRKFLIIIFVLSIISSCNFPEHYFSPAPECKSQTETSKNNDDLTPANQTTLRNKIRNAKPKDYRYFFKTFIEEANNSYMITNFRNNESCFNIKMLVAKWDKLAGMKRTNGVSYPNELYDLKWEIRTINGKEEVVYKNMHSIID